MPRRYVLLVDIPSYAVSITSPYRELLERRLKAQTVINEQRLGFAVRRSDLPYSRGLLLVAAYLEQRGHQVRYLVYADSHDAQSFTDLCQEAHVIGFTAMTPVVQQVYALCRQAKQLHPSLLCVLGGPHANAMAEHCLEECPDLDVVITGNGEVPFAQLVDHLTSYQIYFGFLTLESVQLQAYEERIGNTHRINQASAESLDYLYRCYVQQIGPQIDNATLRMKNGVLFT